MFAYHRRIAAVAAGLATALIAVVLDSAFAVAWAARHVIGG
jgi:hypothetical protein